MPQEVALRPAGRSQLPAAVGPGERLCQEFLAGRSPNTLNAYRQDLAAFAAFQGARGPGEALGALIALSAGAGNSWLLAWRAAMQEAGLAPATINRRLSAVRSALRFARTIGATTWMPEIKGLKAQTYRDTRGPGLDGTRALLAAASQKPPAKAARDIAIIRLMFDLGLRRGEVVGLDVDDVDRDGRRLWVLGKGRAQKEARTLHAATQEAIDRWLAVRSRVAGADEQALFVNVSHKRPGTRITGNGVYRVRAMPLVIGHAPTASGMRASRRPSIRAMATCGLRRLTRGTRARRRRCGTTTIGKIWRGRLRLSLLRRSPALRPGHRQDGSNRLRCHHLRQWCAQTLPDLHPRAAVEPRSNRGRGRVPSGPARDR